LYQQGLHNTKGIVSLRKGKYWRKYLGLWSHAELLDMNEMKELLGQTLEEEKMTDEKLTQAAQKINVKAKR
jgi:ferritin-like metal-binding protein YciE